MTVYLVPAVVAVALDYGKRAVVGVYLELVRKRGVAAVVLEPVPENSLVGVVYIAVFVVAEIIDYVRCVFLAADGKLEAARIAHDKPRVLAVVAASVRTAERRTGVRLV